MTISGWTAIIFILAFLVMIVIIIRLRTRVRLLQHLLSEIEGEGDKEEEHYDRAGG